MERAAGLIPAVRRGPHGGDEPRRSLQPHANRSNRSQFQYRSVCGGEPGELWTLREAELRRRFASASIGWCFQRRCTQKYCSGACSRSLQPGRKPLRDGTHRVGRALVVLGIDRFFYRDVILQRASRCTPARPRSSARCSSAISAIALWVDAGRPKNSTKTTARPAS